MSASIFTVNICDSGFLAGIKVPWSGEVSVSLGSWVTKSYRFINYYFIFILVFIHYDIRLSFFVQGCIVLKEGIKTGWSFFINYQIFLHKIRNNTLNQNSIRVWSLFLLCDCKRSPRLRTFFITQNINST